MYKVFIVPQFNQPDRADGGIRRVVEAQIKYLPDYGIEPVRDQYNADLVAIHGTETSVRTDVPIVAHCHGLYWDSYQWDSWANQVNRQVTDSLARAVAHTAPSHWVGQAMRRGMMIYPEVVYHGVDPNDFAPPATPGEYILWNKARQDPVSDPTPVNEVAKLLANRSFVTTIGISRPNVKVTGTVPYNQMRSMVAGAGLYLATAQETFGIGTLEAMACGVPIVGWDWGGQSEIIKQGETGMLVEVGNYKALAAAIEHCFVNRKMMGQNARQDVIDRWTWPHRIKQYADIYSETIRWWNSLKPHVSVIVTCHNLARFLNDALQSVADQDMQDWECLIIDDASQDATPQVAEVWTKKDSRFKYFRTPENLKLTGARNFGIAKSSGRHIIMLDADDMFEKNCLSTLSTALDADPALHIAYGHLDMVSEDGGNRQRCDFPPDQFNWFCQMAHYNQLPYSSMVRREVFERTGGYRIRAWRAEDAEFWCRATSFGFRAKKVTRGSMLIYRNRSNSKSKGEPGDGDWTAWYAWRLAGRALEVPYSTAAGGTLAKPNVTPFGAQGEPNGAFWPVRNYCKPDVSVIIPVGPGHEKHVIDALDSLVAQTFTNWEVIVVNDTGKKWSPSFLSPVAGAPYARLVTTKGKMGAGHARNVGAKLAKADILFWLDADDYLLPDALSDMLHFYGQTGDAIIYSDWVKNDKGEMTEYATNDFDCGKVLEKLQHSVSCLIPRKSHDAIGGFDETLEGWEDWDYYIALQTLGLCSFRVPKPLFVYGFTTGKRRENSYEHKPELLKKIHSKWIDYYEGRKTMPCGSCGGKKRPTLPRPPAPTATVQEVQSVQSASGVLLVEYQGLNPGPLTFRGEKTGALYRFGLDSGHRRKYVKVEDIPSLTSKIQGGKPMFVVVST